MGDAVVRVKRDLCLGCGLCLDACQRDAISIVSGQAEIDQRRCNHCGACIAYCPQDAIVELTPVSKAELQASVAALRTRAGEILARIDALQRKQRVTLPDRTD